MDSKYNKDFELGFSPLTVCEEASRCLLCLDAPCSKACPAGTNPDKFIRSVRFRNFKGAAETIRENNALGAICARVCPTEKYCQKGCSRSGIDRPIDIGRIQRYVTDYEESLNMEILKAGKDNGKAVALVGSGPASLQAAVSFRQLGYKVDVYEKENVLGGMLRLIPEYRLPNHIVDKEIKRIENLGVNFFLNKEVGKEISLDELKEKYDAVVLAVGYSYGKMLPMFKDSSIVTTAVDFLREIKAKKGDVKIEDNVLVIGGGDVAMDVVTTLKLLNVDHVTDVVYEKFDEFKASKKELEGAQKMGVTIIDGYMPISIEDNVVTFAHREIKSELRIKTNKIILAVGQYPDVNGLGIELVKNEVNTGRNYFTNDPKVFVCGDIAHSRFDKTVVGGVRTGKEVALYVDMILGGK
ncbi:MAG TPA: dihydropyrimidine dehydrogenase [Firmicutes bacterium]|nr:dihydropyrimidine dehydrogenase [Bacillota bacterium]